MCILNVNREHGAQISWKGLWCFIDKIFQWVEVSDMFPAWKLFNQSADLLHPMRKRPAQSRLSKPAAGSPLHLHIITPANILKLSKGLRTKYYKL